MTSPLLEEAPLHASEALTLLPAAPIGGAAEVALTQAVFRGHESIDDDEKRGFFSKVEEVITPLPWPQFYILVYVGMIEPLSATSIMPIAVEATRLSGIVQDEKSLGFAAGMIEGMFHLAEALCVLQWGRLSDRIGRKPVLIIGCIGSALSTASFGLSRSFYALVGSRMLSGLLNGNIGVFKSCAGETLDDSNEAQGFAVIAGTFAMACVTGPLLGGVLSHPERKFGQLFQHPFWTSHPFALSTFAVAALSLLGALLSAIGLKETLPSKASTRYQRLPDLEDEKTPPQPMSPGSPGLTEVVAPVPSLRELMSIRKIRVAISAYLNLAGVDMGFVSAFVLWGSTSVANGGLGLSAATIGLFLAVEGGLAGTTQAIFYSWASRRYGPKRIYRTAMAFWAVPFALMPLANLAARYEYYLLATALLALMIPAVCMADAGYACTFVFVQNSAPRDALGSVNGISQTFIALIRFAGPILASSLFAWSISNNILGGCLMQVIFVVWALFSSIVVGSWLPDKVTRERRASDEMQEV